ncbi:hypothetical protein BGZ76_004375, partial [Entomortierella beljakovae]
SGATSDQLPATSWIPPGSQQPSNPAKLVRWSEVTDKRMTTILSKIALFDKDNIDDFIRELKDLPMLNHLKLSFGYQANGYILNDIITTSGYLSSLHIESYSYSQLDPLEDEELQNIKETTYQMENIKIKSLRIGVSSKQHETAILVPLVERCKHLEDLQILSICYRTNRKKIANVLVDEKLSKFHFERGWPEGHDIEEPYQNRNLQQ